METCQSKAMQADDGFHGLLSDLRRQISVFVCKLKPAPRVKSTNHKTSGSKRVHAAEI